MQKRNDFNKNANPVYKFLIIICTVFILLGITALYFYGPDESQVKVSEVDTELIEDGIHVRTGLIAADGLQTVINNCTTCHSSKLIIQNRMGEEQWNATIRWMQKTQGLWELGENQKIVVDYLVKNYPTLEKGRRPALTNIDWYELKE
jgi:hypothetical protein